MPCASCREAIDAHNRAHPALPLPRPAARLLAVMFDSTSLSIRTPSRCSASARRDGRNGWNMHLSPTDILGEMPGVAGEMGRANDRLDRMRRCFYPECPLGEGFS
jgi:hypothetical protein